MPWVYPGGVKKRIRLHVSLVCCPKWDSDHSQRPLEVRNLRAIVVDVRFRNGFRNRSSILQEDRVRDGVHGIERAALAADAATVPLPARVAELGPAAARHVRAAPVALDELLAARAAHPPMARAELQHCAVARVVCAHVGLRGVVAPDGGLAARAGASVADGVATGEDVYRGVLVPFAEEAAAPRIGAVKRAVCGSFDLEPGE